MPEGERSRFVRSVGDVVLDSFHPASFLTGIVLSIPLLLGGILASKTHNQLLANVCILASVPLAMYAQSRLALNGLAEQSAGGFFSDGGGTVEDVLPVFGRFLALSVLWALPLAAMIASWDPKLQSFAHLPFSAVEPPPALLVVYLGSSLVVPFFLLTVAVAATRFTEIFSGALWGGLFGGRLGEVFLMVVATAGAPLAVLLALVPWLASLALKAPDFAGFLAGVLGIYLGGVTLSIHAKLCGFFAAALLQEEVQAPVRPEAPDTPGAAPGPASSSPASSAPGVPLSRAWDDDLRQAWAMFPSDPQGAIARLGTLAAAPVPDAKILHGLALMKRKAGDEAGALEAARQAIPVCLRANEGKLAAELYRNHAADARNLWLDHTQLVAVGDVLFSQNDPSAAANAWANALNADAGDRKAFKGLLKVADQVLQSGEPLDRAIRIYDFLLQRAPESPFADHARAQLEIAKRKAAKG